MHLIEIFLPLYDNSKRPFDDSLYDEVNDWLKEKFGGVTFYRKTPAEGLWKASDGKTNFDELVVAEVIVDELDKEWWQKFKNRLQKTFRQDEIMIRAIRFEKL